MSPAGTGKYPVFDPRRTILFTGGTFKGTLSLVRAHRKDYELVISLKKLPAVFYRTPTGAEPVREWLKSLPLDDRRVIGADLQTVEFGWPIGMPTCRSLGGGLWEVRSNIRDGIARLIFFVHEGEAVMLNGFVKKTQKTPDAEIDLARKRRREIEK